MMSKQLSIFDICRNNHGGNKNSETANKAISGMKISIANKILNYIRKQGGKGATCEEIEQQLGMSHQTVSARCSELKAKKLVVVTGRRETASGCLADVLGAI